MSDADNAVTLRIGGSGADVFLREAGGHRWQRIPPTERGGRKHSSTVTVAVIAESGSTDSFRESDCTLRVYRGSGPGGQHKNKTETAVEATHMPTGIKASCESERSQTANKESALRVLRARVLEAGRQRQHATQNATRKQQVGTGMRSDKIRTVQEQNGRVVNHTNGKKVSLKRYLKGDLDALH